MDTKLELLVDTFQSRFTVQKFLSFSTQFFIGINLINPDNEIAVIPEYSCTIAACRHMAKYSKGKSNIGFFIVKLNANVMRADANHIKFASYLLSDRKYDAAIIAYFKDNEPDWKLSFLRLDCKCDGSMRNTGIYAKAYSYLLGENEPCHMAMIQLYPIYKNEKFTPSLNKIEEAFSDDKAAKNFVDNYEKKYLSIKKQYIDEGQSATSGKCALTLMCRLTLQYFLQKKGWIHLSDRQRGFSIPNELFSNISINKEAVGNLDFLDRYNFSLYADKPFERKVAVNPEVFGKAFEKLMGDFGRKPKGAFYTPDEIVRYMCAGSLASYVAGKTGLSYEDIKAFITDRELTTEEDCKRLCLPDSISSNLHEIDGALRTIKVLDPAVGTGVFPVGMLAAIVKARNNITYYYALQTKDNAIRKINFEYRAQYSLKLATIKNCIFAADIDVLAVEIAKLRLWLTLLLDDDMAPGIVKLRKNKAKTNIFDTKEDEMLLNLDKNIVCGDSLVDGLFANETMDVVIGNPPYVDSAYMVKNMPEIRAEYAKKYRVAKGNWDLFLLFIELGMCCSSEKGVIAFIVPNKLIGVQYAKEARKLLAEGIREIRDYSDVRVFTEAAVYPITFIVSKGFIGFVKLFKMKDLKEVKWQSQILTNAFKAETGWDSFFLRDGYAVNIVQKMKMNTALDKLAVVKGAATVSEAYKISGILSCIADQKQGHDFFKFINTGTIDRYCSLWHSGKTRYIKKVYIMPVISKMELKEQYPKRFLDAESPKIIICGISKSLECYYDTGEYLAGKSTVIILNSNVDLRYLTGLLNSKLISFYYRCCFNSLSLDGGFLPVGVPQIRQLPIAFGKADITGAIINSVIKILSLKRDGHTADTSSQEAEIDRMVYELYSLSDDEIRIVEDMS